MVAFLRCKLLAVVLMFVSIVVYCQKSGKESIAYFKGQWIADDLNTYCFYGDSVRLCDDNCYCLSWIEYLSDSTAIRSSGQKWNIRFDKSKPVIYFYTDASRKSMFSTNMYIIVDSTKHYIVYPDGSSVLYKKSILK